MTDDWLDTTIGEQVTLQRGFDITKREQKEGEVPVVSSGGVSSFHDAAQVRGPGVVLGRKGALGTVYYLEEDFWPHDTTLWVKDFHGNEPQYVYYFFLSTAKRLLNLDVGSANPTLNRNHVHPIRVPWPREAEQSRIARILGTLDDKIELNRKMNRTLEEIAQTLFRAWFVDFEVETDFVESEVGLIPRGWGVGTVADFAQLNAQNWGKNNAPEEIEYLDLATVKWGEIGEPARLPLSDAPSRARRCLREGDTLIGTVRPANGSFGLIQYSSPNLTGSTGFAVLSPKEPELKYFLYLWLTRPEFIEHLASLAHGSAYPAVRAELIHRAPLPIPPRGLRAKFHHTVTPLFERKHLNSQESRTLAELRDTLLPKLISGEIRVPEAEELVGEAV